MEHNPWTDELSDDELFRAIRHEFQYFEKNHRWLTEHQDASEGMVQSCNDQKQTAWLTIDEALQALIGRTAGRQNG